MFLPAHGRRRSTASTAKARRSSTLPVPVLRFELLLKIAFIGPWDGRNTTNTLHLSPSFPVGKRWGRGSRGGKRRGPPPHCQTFLGPHCAPRECSVHAGKWRQRGMEGRASVERWSCSPQVGSRDVGGDGATFIHPLLRTPSRSSPLSPAGRTNL